MVDKIWPRDRFQQAIYVLFLLIFVASCIDPPYPDFLLMQHFPTLLGAILLPYLANRSGMSRLSFTSIALFLCLHTLGARFLYSYVPYDQWAEAWFGFNISQAFGWERNHYDRLVHFSFGLLWAIPVREFERRHLRLSVGVASLLAVEFVLAISGGYELIEWLVAVVFTPDWADQFLGQQGDIFDAQKDMSLATAGAILSVVAVGLMERWRSGTSAS